MVDTTYTWKITNLCCMKDFDSLQNYVYQVDWYCSGHYSGISGVADYTMNKSTFVSSLNNTDFIPYDELKEEQVFDWVFYNENSGPTPQSKQDLQNIVDIGIQNLLNPPYINPPLPW